MLFYRFVILMPWMSQSKHQRHRPPERDEPPHPLPLTSPERPCLSCPPRLPLSTTHHPDSMSPRMLTSWKIQVTHIKKDFVHLRSTSKLIFSLSKIFKLLSIIHNSNFLIIRVVFY